MIVIISTLVAIKGSDILIGYFHPENSFPVESRGVERYVDLRENNPNFKAHIPNKIIESLENGIPFITSIDGTLKRIIDEYKNGIFIKNEEDIDISQIERLLNDNNYLKNIKNNCKKSYEKLFNFEKTFDKIIENIIEM